MSIFEVVRLLLDFGLVILIWLVQLVIYSAFPYYGHKELMLWHKKYTSRITLIVIPLMIGQLVISIIEILKNTSMFNIIICLSIYSIWIVTFFFIVPIHKKINKSLYTPFILRKLIKINWLRTILWTLIFALSLMQNVI
ncbi:hypothetical protein [Aquimarina algiphila]|uniref:hypothetical protein n=1 Tax=Aquimarina algiphila TaxID=2047982 RepID=UPI0023300167|nr:hypothetical protein [Aquimarina algiphila]